MPSDAAADDVAFVLGGGGQLGAHEVGMLRALLERGIVPDLVVGTSVGAINGAAVAAQPGLDAIAVLERTWRDVAGGEIFNGSVVRRARTFATTRTHLHEHES